MRVKGSLLSKPKKSHLQVSVKTTLRDDIGAVADEDAVAADKARTRVAAALAGVTTSRLTRLNVYRPSSRPGCQEEEEEGEGVDGPHGSICRYGFVVFEPLRAQRRCREYDEERVVLLLAGKEQ